MTQHPQTFPTDLEFYAIVSFSCMIFGGGKDFEGAGLFPIPGHGTFNGFCKNRMKKEEKQTYS